jgi:predicted ester cyclase
MSTEANKAIARREIEEFEGKGNLAVADEVLAPNYRLHFPGFPPLDREGHKQVISVFRNAFPDMRITVESQLSEGERVANHIIMLGTHQGEFQGIPATG